MFNIDKQTFDPTAFEDFLRKMLNDVPDKYDKRTSSVVYNTLAPTAAVLADQSIVLEIFNLQRDIRYATGKNLDEIGFGVGVERFGATKAQRIAKFYDMQNNPIDIEIGNRFSTPVSRRGESLVFIATARRKLGEYTVTCETLGSKGNDHFGAILPIFSDNFLRRAEIVETLIPARDTETDEAYRVRILSRIRGRSFGGNLADYEEILLNFQGVGNVQVFPVPNGGGTVGVSVIDVANNPVHQEFQDKIKDFLDPKEYTGTGVGRSPIGHSVTVSTPEVYVVNIDAKVVLNNVQVGQILGQVRQEIQKYFDTIHMAWRQNRQIVNNNIFEYRHDVFLARVLGSMLNVSSVVNVLDLRLNDQDQDIHLTSTFEKQYLPVLGEVTLYE